jgi:hypothetical protein
MRKNSFLPHSLIKFPQSQEGKKIARKSSSIFEIQAIRFRKQFVEFFFDKNKKRLLFIYFF